MKDRVASGFNVSRRAISTYQASMLVAVMSVFEDAESEALLDEEDENDNGELLKPSEPSLGIDTEPN